MCPIHELFGHSYRSQRYKLTLGSRKGRALVWGARGGIVSKLGHAWEEVRTEEGCEGDHKPGLMDEASNSSSSLGSHSWEMRDERPWKGMDSILFGCVHRLARGQEPRLQIHPNVPSLRIRDALMLGRGCRSWREQTCLWRAFWFSNSQRVKDPFWNVGSKVKI